VKVSDLFLLPDTKLIGRRTGFEANAAAAPINATPAKAFNAIALMNKYNSLFIYSIVSIFR